MNKKLLSFFAGSILLLPSLAFAIGLGSVRTHSHLNERLKAEIPILSVKKKGKMTVTLANNAQFAKRGIQRNDVLNNLSFSLTQRNGRQYINLSSSSSISVPYLNFILNLNSPEGTVSREYAIFLDPPSNKAKSNKKNNNSNTSPYKSTRKKQNSSATNKKNKQNKKPQISSAKGGKYGPIRKGETLWSIASYTRPSASISVGQMVKNIKKANPRTLSGKLQAGAIITIPTIQGYKPYSGGYAPLPVAAVDKEKTKLDIKKKSTVKTKETINQNTSSSATKTPQKTDSINTLNAVSKETPKAVSKETPKAVNKETPKAVSKETPKAVSKETPKAVSKETPKAVNKETPKAVSKETPKAVSKETPKAVSKETPKAVSKETAKTPIAKTPSNTKPQPIKTNNASPETSIVDKIIDNAPLIGGGAAVAALGLLLLKRRRKPANDIIPLTEDNMAELLHEDKEDTISNSLVVNDDTSDSNDINDADTIIADETDMLDDLEFDMEDFDSSSILTDVDNKPEDTESEDFSDEDDLLSLSDLEEDLLSIHESDNNLNELLNEEELMYDSSEKSNITDTYELEDSFDFDLTEGDEIETSAEKLTLSEDNSYSNNIDFTLDDIDDGNISSEISDHDVIANIENINDDYEHKSEHVFPLVDIEGDTSILNDSSEDTLSLIDNEEPEPIKVDSAEIHHQASKTEVDNGEDPVSPPQSFSRMQMKISLARSFISIEEEERAKKILEEVITDSNSSDEQLAEAKKILLTIK